jgi:hypothetical protein
VSRYDWKVTDAVEHGAPHHPVGSQPHRSSAQNSSGRCSRAWTWREVATGADIMPDFAGSDHAPVWLEVDSNRMAPLEGLPTGARRLPEASRSLFSGGKQAQLSALWKGVAAMHVCE